jgi:hypothetical protein
MQLPQINADLKFTVTLPSGEGTIIYRPFTAAEEKIIMVAKEANSLTTVIQAVEQILDNCVLNENFKASDLHIFDVEFLFIQIRAKSVTEEDEFSIKCENCETVNKIPFNYETDIKVRGLENTKAAMEVELNADYSLKMKWPTLGTFAEINLTETPDFESEWAVLEACVDGLKGPDEYFKFSDASPAERTKFLRSLTSPQMAKVKAFADTFPVVTANVSFVCGECAEDNQIKVEGLANFFG